MIQPETKVNIVDNTGAKKGLIIKVLKGSYTRFGTVGDMVSLAVKSAVPGGSVQKGEVVRGIVVRTSKEIGRQDGSYIRFGDNAVALVNKDGSVRGKRIFGPVAKELREKGSKNVANIAEEII